MNTYQFPACHADDIADFLSSLPDELLVRSKFVCSVILTDKEARGLTRSGFLLNVVV